MSTTVKTFKRAVKAKHGGIFSGGNACLGLLCGKTELLFNMLTRPGVLDFNNLYIYTPTTNQTAYQFIEHGFSNNLTKEAINYLFHAYEEDEDIDVSIEDFCKEGSKKPEMVDDVSTASNAINSKRTPYRCNRRTSRSRPGQIRKVAATH